MISGKNTVIWLLYNGADVAATASYLMEASQTKYFLMEATTALYPWRMPFELEGYLTRARTEQIWIESIPHTNTPWNGRIPHTLNWKDTSNRELEGYLKPWSAQIWIGRIPHTSTMWTVQIWIRRIPHTSTPWTEQIWIGRIPHTSVKCTNLNWHVAPEL